MHSRLDDLEQRRSRLRQWVRSSTSGSVETRGVSHIAVFAKDFEATARFYQEVRGLPVVNVIANRDVPESTHMNMDISDGESLSILDFPHVPRLRRRASAASCMWPSPRPRPTSRR